MAKQTPMKYQNREWHSVRSSHIQSLLSTCHWIQWFYPPNIKCTCKMVFLLLHSNNYCAVGRPSQRFDKTKRKIPFQFIKMSESH